MSSGCNGYAPIISTFPLCQRVDITPFGDWTRLLYSSELFVDPSLFPCHHVTNNRLLTSPIPIVMPALSSFIPYRPGKRAKAAIKAPFSLLHRDSSTASSSASHQPFTPPDVVEPPDVIDINHSHFSLDSDGGDHKDSFEQDVLDSPRSYQLNLSTSPQVELDIDLSSNGLSDWLEAFSGDSKKEGQIKKRFTRLNHPVSLDVRLEKLKEGEGETDRGASSSEDMAASLRTMDVSCKIQIHLFNTGSNYVIILQGRA